MADAPSTDAPATPAPKGKPWLVIALVVFALAAGGGGAFFFMKGKSSDTHEKDAKEGSEEGAPKGPAQYVKLEPPFVVNFEAKGLMRFLQVTVEVMTRDPVTADLINKNDPMIRNDMIMLLGNQTYETISSREGKEKLRADALAVVAKVIESEGGDPKKVEQLYFTSFVMQ